MKNLSLLRKTLALILVISFAALCLVSCDFSVEGLLSDEEEATAEAKELVGAELTEVEQETKELIEERIADFYRDIENKNFDFVRMNFTPPMRAGMQVIYYGSTIIFENDAFELLVPATSKVVLGNVFSLCYDEFRELECESILLSGDEADVTVKLQTEYGETKRHEVTVKYDSGDWFLSWFPLEAEAEEV